MGELILLSERRERIRSSRTSPDSYGVRATFFFDPACPFSYLAAERVERVLGDVDWVPARRTSLRPGPAGLERGLIRDAERRAIELRLPLSWPDPFPDQCTPALRACLFAAEHGAGPRFALAAARLAFCGGFDLADPDILAAAAEASGVSVEGARQAALDPARDAQLELTEAGLRARGTGELPAICVDERWFEGERGVAEASALLRARAIVQRPLAPAG